MRNPILAMVALLAFVASAAAQNINCTKITIDDGSGNKSTITGSSTAVVLSGLTQPAAQTLGAATTVTGTAGKTLTWSRTLTDATAENALNLNVTALDTTSGTTAQYGFRINNAASSEALDALLLFDTADADDTVASIIKVLNTGAGTGFTNLIDTPNLDITYAGAITGITSLSLSNSETIVNTTNGQFTLGRNDAGVVIVTAADDDAVAGLTILPGGAAPFVLGGAATTSVTVTTDGTGGGEFVVPDQSIGTAEITDAAIDADKTANTLCLSTFSTVLDPTEASATDDFAVFNCGIDAAGIASCQDTTETNVQSFIAPVAGYIHNLRVLVDTAPGAGNDPWTITLREAGGSDVLTCTIDEAATTCADTTNVAAVAAGAKLNWLVSSAGGDGDPTAAGQMIISACWGQ